MLPLVRPIQLISFLQGHCAYKYYARCTSNNSFHCHVSAYTNSKIVFLARVLLLRIFCILVLRFSSACSCNTRPTGPFAYVFYAPCIPMYVAATLHIIFICFVLFLFLFVLSTYGVLCISIACNITIQCLFLPLAYYLSLAYVSHVYRWPLSICVFFPFLNN